jgi:spore germination cell wall hydrolase CwlJ-like protein
MVSRNSQALLRADRVFAAAIAVIIATASAAIGATAVYSPKTTEILVTRIIEPVVHTVVADVAPPIAQKSRADVIEAKLLAEHRCLSEVIYYEARGEGEGGQRAIAEVVFHRMRHGNFGHSICAVVYEGAGHPGCQFSFACNGELDRPKEAGPWRDAQVLAARILTGEVMLTDSTEDATHFHAVSVTPEWTGDMQRTVQIGNHVFYKFTRTRSL